MDSSPKITLVHRSLVLDSQTEGYAYPLQQRSVGSTCFAKTNPEQGLSVRLPHPLPRFAGPNATPMQNQQRAAGNEALAPESHLGQTRST